MLVNLYHFLGKCVPNTLLKTVFWHRARKGKESSHRQQERFGSPSRKRPDGRIVWIHGASVGELASARGLMQSILEADPNINILITSGTVASAKFIEPLLGDRCIHQFIPYDSFKCVNRFLDYWRPDVALWIESEFWPNLFESIRNRGIASYLINGRMSYKSFLTWKKDMTGIKKILSTFSFIFAQSSDHRDRMSALGAENVEVYGNIKLLSPPLLINSEEQKAFKAVLGDSEWVMAASTHDGEEELVLDAFEILKRQKHNVKLTLAPRHPDRSKKVQRLLQSRGLSFCLHSELHPYKTQFIRDSIDVYLVDTIGSLGSFFAMKPIVFLGGSLVDVGGHNFIEPLMLGSVPIVGPYMHKQEELLEPFKKRNIIMQVSNPFELAYKMLELLNNPHLQEEVLYNSQLTIEEQRRSLGGLMEIILERARGLCRESA